MSRPSTKEWDRLNYLVHLAEDMLMKASVQRRFESHKDFEERYRKSKEALDALRTKRDAVKVNE